MSQNDQYETNVLLHWNADKQREEIWLHIGLPEKSMESPGIARRIATKELGYSPLTVICAATYLHGRGASGSRHWLAGPITEEEAATL